MMRRSSIVGVGESKFFRRGRSAPLTVLDLALAAVEAALGDAGLTGVDIDGFVILSGGPDLPLLAHALGLPQVRFTAAVPGGGGGSAATVALADMAVRTGTADVVVSLMSLQQRTYRIGAGQATPYSTDTADQDFVVPFGLVTPAQGFAMVAQRHMHLYGTTRRHFAEVAISTRINAMSRPSALMRTPMTETDYLESQMICDPLCLFDCCLESDGAVAIVTTSAARARDLRQQPVTILGAAMGGPGRHHQSVSWLSAPDDFFTSGYHRQVADRLYASAGVRPSDVSVAEIYDHFAPMVLLQLEDYGFCGVGESGDFVAEGHIRWPTGSLPVNTHGGNLSEAYVMGMTHIKEAVEQVRGTAVNQVAGAEVALATGGSAQLPVSAVLLGAG